MRRRDFLATAFVATTPLPNAGDVFDAVWTGVCYRFYDPRTRGVDWSAVRDEFRPKARACVSEEMLLAVLREMLGRLRNSHIFFY